MQRTEARQGTGWPVGRVVLVVTGVLLFMGALGGWYVGFHDKGMNLRFDPDTVAEVETRMWKIYYGGGSRIALGVDLLTLMREQFGLSYNTSIHIAEEVASATVLFRDARGEVEYEQKVLPALVRGYTRLRTAVRGTWNAEAVARAELDWWAARREPERSAPEQVGAGIAREYSLVYGIDNAHVRRAGLLRAQAAHLRDLGGSGATDWAGINAMLHESYRELSVGVQP